jgi:hypothetical protein
MARLTRIERKLDELLTQAKAGNLETGRPETASGKSHS